MSRVSGKNRNGSALNLRPEVELLLHVARTRLKPTEAQVLKRLVLNIEDWDYLLRTAYRHGLMPLLHAQLGTLCEGTDVPADRLSELRDQFHRNAARNILLAEELRRILSLLAEKGIKAVPYKGPALALSLYGDTAYRQFVDLDIIIRERDLAKATEALLSCGYLSPHRMSNAREAAYLTMKREQLFTNPQARSCVEIHWAFASKPLAPALCAERVWERLEAATLEGAATHALAPEDLLLILCVHGGKHLWERLAWLCDAAELIEARPHLDWERILSEASELGVRRLLLLGLSLIDELLNAPLPEAVRQEVMADSTVTALTWQLHEKLFSEDAHALGTTQSLIFNYRVRERRLDGARYCCHTTIAPTPAEWSALDLPENLSFLYYLFRPVRLIKKHASFQLRRLAGA